MSEVQTLEQKLKQLKRLLDDVIEIKKRVVEFNGLFYDLAKLVANTMYYVKNAVIEFKDPSLQENLIEIWCELRRLLTKHENSATIIFEIPGRCDSTIKYLMEIYMKELDRIKKGEEKK